MENRGQEQLLNHDCAFTQMRKKKRAELEEVDKLIQVYSKMKYDDIYKNENTRMLAPLCESVYLFGFISDTN